MPSTIDPYFTADGISRTIDVYDRTSKPLSGQGGDYSLKTRGASIRFGVPFTENDTVYFGSGYEQLTIVPGTNLPASYQTYANQFAYKSDSIPLTVGWSRDSRDSSLVPTTGRYQRATATQAWRATSSSCAPITRSSIHSAEQTVHRRAERRIWLGQGPERPALSAVQELLLGRPRVGARL